MQKNHARMEENTKANTKPPEKLKNQWKQLKYDIYGKNITSPYDYSGPLWKK